MAAQTDDRVFASAKRTILFKLKQEYDRSPKGSIDELALPIVTHINGLEDYVTTSSCSGRIAVFSLTAYSDDHEKAATSSDIAAATTVDIIDGDEESTKGRGRWVFVTHGPASITEAELATSLASCKGDVSTFLKVEPFILHVQCRNIEAAQKLMRVAMGAGFRESGIGVGSSGKIIVAVRSTSNCLEVPLQHDGVTIASAEYLSALIEICEQKFRHVHARRNKFFEVLQKELPLPTQATASAAVVSSVVCSSCGVAFPSRNKLFTTHLIEDRVAGKRVCPVALPAKTGHSCTICSSTFATRNQLFKHLSTCKIDKSCWTAPRKPHLLAPIVPLTESDFRAAEAAEALAAQVVNRALQRQHIAPARHNASNTSSIIWTQESESPLLHRYGHSAVRLVVGGHPVLGSVQTVVVFGGYSGSGTHARSNDVIVRIGEHDTWQRLSFPVDAAGPPARTKHAAVTVGLPGGKEGMLVFGGHAGLLHPLNDIWLLQLNWEPEGALTGEWKQVAVDNMDVVPGRWGHTATAVRASSLPAAFCAEEGISADMSCILTFGGRNVDQSFDDSYLLVPVPSSASIRMRWVRVGDSTHLCPPPRFCHSAVGITAYVATKECSAILVHGGFAAPHVHGLHGCAKFLRVPRSPLLADVWLLDLTTLQWHEIHIPEKLEGRMSHCMVAIPPKADAHSATCVVFGGATQEPMRNHAVVLEVSVEGADRGLRWRACSAKLHDNSAYGGILLAKGDAAVDTCFTALVSPTIPQVADRAATNKIAWPLRGAAVTLYKNRNLFIHSIGGGGVAFAFGSHYATSMVGQLYIVNDNAEVAAVPSSGNSAALAVDIKAAEAAKCVLRSGGWYDASRVCAKFGTSVCIPLTECALEMLRATGIAPEPLRALMASGNARIEMVNLRKATEIKGAAYGHLGDLERVKIHMLSEMQRGGWEEEAASVVLTSDTGLPRAVEFLGDVLVVPAAALTHKQLLSVMDLALLSLARCLKVERIARRGEIGIDGSRSSMLHMLLTKTVEGAYSLPAKVVPCTSALSAEEATRCLRRVDYSNGGWVKVRENGLQYVFDMTRVMFSSGNVSEKARMAKLSCVGETIVDLFAGIGYFTLPLLVHANAAFIHACEWNSDAIHCLAMNLAANRVDPSRYKLWPGDNQQLLATSLTGSVDRVLLGLIPTSERAWKLAVALLKPSGGWLHVHMNKCDSELASWPAELEAVLASFSVECGRMWTINVRHVERVKSYAPHVWHVVADVECRKTDTSAAP